MAWEEAMRISACIGFKDRDVALLQAGIHSLSNSVHEVSVANLSDGEIHAMGSIVKEVHMPGIPWREALSKNIAALHSTGDVLLFTNCGILISPDVIQGAMRLLFKGATFVCPAQMFIRCNKMQTDNYLACRASELGCDPQWQHEEAGMGDFLLIYKSDFVSIGGFDSRFTGWGGFDRDFNERAEDCGYKRKIAPGTIYHLWDGLPAGQHETDGGGWKANQEIMKTNQKTNWWRNELRRL